MREEVVIRVNGVPAPGGSKSAFVPTNKQTGQPYRKNGRIIVNVVDAGGKANRVWKQVVNATACEQFREPPWDCPIDVEFHFVLPRPKYHYGTGKNAHLLKPGTPQMHTSKPDLTKFIRSTEDALTGRLWVDDAQICTQLASKSYGAKPGVKVVMREALNPVVTADVSEPEPPPFAEQFPGQFEKLREKVATQ